MRYGKYCRLMGINGNIEGIKCSHFEHHFTGCRAIQGGKELLLETIDILVVRHIASDEEELVHR